MNGVEIARRIFVETNPSELSGTLFVLPSLNTYGLRAGSRYMHDRRDLNRSFPQAIRREVLPASLPALCSNRLSVKQMHWSIYTRHLTGGSTCPRFGPIFSSPEALDLARDFGIGVVLHGKGPKGSLREQPWIPAFRPSSTKRVALTSCRWKRSNVVWSCVT